MNNMPLLESMEKLPNVWECILSKCREGKTKAGKQYEFIPQVTKSVEIKIKQAGEKTTPTSI